MEGPGEVLGIIGFFVCLLVLGSLFLRNRHRERLALIQYGKDSSVFSKSDNKNRALKVGLLLMSIGAGILIGGIFDYVFNTFDTCKFACSFLFGGFSLIYYHQYINNNENDNINGRSRRFTSDADDDEMI